MSSNDTLKEISDILMNFLPEDLYKQVMDMITQYGNTKYDAGNEVGYDWGYSEGHRRGIAEGKKEGYDNGYRNGLDTACERVTAVYDMNLTERNTLIHRIRG